MNAPASRITRRTTPLFAAGHMVPQLSKRQRRPVWEPHIHIWDIEIPTSSYPARRVRRYLRQRVFTLDFDFVRFFDQFALSESAQEFTVAGTVSKKKTGAPQGRRGRA